MINFLLELGIEEKEIKNLMEQINDFVDYEDHEKNIEILRSINCSEKQIKNIVISNPIFLIRSNSDIVKLVKTLIDFGFKDLDEIFDTNPYLLNKDDFEIVNYFNSKQNEGLSNDDILDLIESNFYEIEE